MKAKKCVFKVLANTDGGHWAAHKRNCKGFAKDGGAEYDSVNFCLLIA